MHQIAQNEKETLLHIAQNIAAAHTAQHVAAKTSNNKHPSNKNSRGITAEWSQKDRNENYWSCACCSRHKIFKICIDVYMYMEHVEYKARAPADKNK